MSLEIETIKQVEQETKRFLKRLDAAKKRLIKDEYVSITGCKESGALKRAALDLKMELTSITK